MEIIKLLCKGLDALEDKLSDEALKLEKCTSGTEEENISIAGEINYLRGQRDAFESVRRSLEDIRFKS